MLKITTTPLLSWLRPAGLSPHSVLAIPPDATAFSPQTVLAMLPDATRFSGWSVTPLAERRIHSALARGSTGRRTEIDPSILDEQRCKTEQKP